MRRGRWTALTLLMLLMCYGQITRAVKCFSCTVKPVSERVSNGTQRLCSKFDGSSRFVVDCPLSTLCQTRTFHLHTHTGSVAVTTRGCAQQDYSYQVFKKNQGWKTVTKIKDDVYKEGCFIAVGSTIRRHRTKYCFCSRELCNGDSEARSLSFSIYSCLVTVLLILVQLD